MYYNLDINYLIENFNITYVLIYLLVINFITFIMFGTDKYKAKHDYWRTPEGTLIIMCLLGGHIGGLIGMKVFHHKTKKTKFTIGVPTILISEICIGIYFILKYYKII